jgi:hypothetical protein
MKSLSIFEKNKIIRFISLLIISLLFFSLLMPFTNIIQAYEMESGSDLKSTRSSIVGEWSSTKIWADQEQLKTVAIGDIDPTNDGNEIVVGGDSQRITMLKGEEVYWGSKMIWYDNWYTNAIEIGDIDPKHEGDEVATVGWDGQVTMIYWKDDNWQTSEIGQRTDYLYDVAIGNVDPLTSTNEVLVVGDDDKLVIYNKNGTNDSWTETEIFQDLDYLHLVTLGDVYPGHEGPEILLSGGSSRLTMVYLENDTVVSKTIFVDERIINAVEVDDFYSGNPGNEIVAVDTNNEIILLYFNGTAWTNQTIFEDTNDLYTVKIGDVDPQNEGLEIVASGLANRLIILNEPDDQNTSDWDTTILPNPGEQNVYLLANAVGDVDPSHEGSEIVTVGYLGKVIITQFEVKDFKIHPVQNTQIVQAGASIDFDFLLSPRGGYDDNVELEVVDNPSPMYLPASFDATTISLPGMARLQIDILEITVTGTYVFKINSSNPDGTIYHELGISLIVESSNSPNFNIFGRPNSRSVIADFSTEYIIEFQSINEFHQPLDISISRLPIGVTAKFNHTTVTPTGSINLTLQTSTITANRTYYLPVHAISKNQLSSGNVIEHSIVLILKVGETGEQDFILETTPFSQKGFINQSVQYNIEVISLFGFKSHVNLEIKNLPDGVISMFSQSFVIPTVNVTLTLSIKEYAVEGDYDLEIVGFYKYTEHSSFVKLSISRETPDFHFIVNPKKVTIHDPSVMEFDVTIYPNSEFSDTLTLTISGLPDDASWNQDLTPIYVDSITGIGVPIKTTGKAEPGIYNLTFTITSDSGVEHNETITLVLADDYGDTMGPEVFFPILICEIMIVIIILIIVVIIYLKRKNK